MTDPDLQSLWQSQENEETTMTLDDIRKAARTFQRRVRRRNLIEYAAGAIVVPAFTLAAWQMPQPLTKLGAALAALGALVCLWQLHVRGSARHAPDTSDSLVAFHRYELQRQRDALASTWLWYLGPLVPGVTVIMLSSWFSPVATPATHIATALMATIVALIFLVVFLLNRMGAMRLQRQIDQLDAARRA